MIATDEPLPVSLPDPLHSHFDPVENRFFEHEHPHGGPHVHGVVNGKIVTVYDHGSNYSPKGTPT